MKKDITMKKNNFVKGAFITTFGIVLAKLLGAFYVIPFHSLIGDAGGALFGYAYTIYTFFVSLASAGIPLAISKLVSEYQALGYHNTKLRVFLLGKRLALIMGAVSFVLVFLLAPFLAQWVLGGVHGVNSVKDVTFVIRVIGSAIVVVPILGVYRGYFEGHRFMSPPSISQVLEQIVRVFVILFGTYVAVKVFHFNLSTSVGVALFGATIGALISYLYLVDKKLKNKAKFQERLRPVNEPIVSNQLIFKKIIYYALPFIVIDFFKSFYNFVDMVTVVKGLVNVAHYNPVDAEVIYSSLSTWASKFNMMLSAISSGVVVSLIPNLTDSLVKGREKDIQKKVTQAISLLIFLTLPMTLGISFLSRPIWTLFYGDSLYGPSVLSYYIFVGFFSSLFVALIMILQTLKDYKAVFFSLFAGAFIKMFFNTSFIAVFDQMKFPAYYGVISATIVGYLCSIILCILVLKNKYNLHLEEIIKNIFDILCGCIIMVFVLCLMKIFISITTSTRMLSFIIILLYGIVGACIYLIFAYQLGIIKKIFGNHMIQSFRKLIVRK